MPTVEQPTATTETEEQPTEEQKKFTVADFLTQIDKEKEQREADDAAAERRGKLREMIGSIGDAAVALNNMMYATKGAPHVPQQSGMGDKARERWEKDKAWREKNRAAWLNYVLNKAGKMQQDETQKAITEREVMRQQAAEKRAAERAAEKQAAADKAAKEKADKESTDNYIKTESPKWDGWLRLNKKKEIDDLLAGWKAALDAGEMSVNAYNSRVEAFNKVANKLYDEKVKAQQKDDKKNDNKRPPRKNYTNTKATGL